MTQSIDAHRWTIGSLLGRYERRPVVLPPFQRAFSWERAQLSVFWEDLIGFDSTYNLTPLTASYFLGSIVVIESDEQILLLDGQQRLATATIALAAMRDLARSLDKAPSTRGADFARDIQREILEKDTDATSYSFTLSELDEPFFLKSIKSDPPAVPSTKLRSHLLIQSAYNLSKAKLEEVTKGLSVDKTLKRLKSLRDALTKGMTVIAIQVQSEEDAYNIFETLNDRGLRLSVPDLVLNLLMRRAPDATARGLVRQHWNTLMRQMGRRDVSRFLRHMWVSMYGDLKAEGLYSAIKRDLEQKKITSVDFAEQCGDECDSYVELLDVNVSLSKAGVTDLEGLVKYLGFASAPPLLLAGYRCLNESDFAKLLAALVNVYVRYGLIANQDPTDLENACFEAAREIRARSEANETSAKQLQAAKGILKKLVVSDAAVEDGAADLVLERSQALWLMTRLANQLQSATKEVGMDRANLEHIFPQNAGPAWPNRANLEPLIWHIGNLSILGNRINRKAQNKSFSDKCSLHYSKSEIRMTKDLLSYPRWDEKAIKKRARALAKQVTQLWPTL
jgi:Protein of unknown function DUF262/Protein of unknown function (DUF1524)